MRVYYDRDADINLIKDKKINIYAGCGIVIDSDPEEETDELKWKLLPLIDSLK